MARQGWIGVDLDGTLAVYNEWRGIEHVGAPVKRMVERVQRWLTEGRKVKIFTARVYGLSGDELTLAVEPIAKFCLEQFGQMLDVTCVKDFAMISLWDDRAIQVVTNQGLEVGAELVEALPWLAEQMARVRSVGKDWWAELQYAQLEREILQKKAIRELTHALEMVRDAHNDVIKDGGTGFLPPIPLSTVEHALDSARLALK